MFAINAHYLFYVVMPFISLVGWLIYFNKKMYSSILAFSILLVIFDTKHLLKFVNEFETSTIYLDLDSIIIFAGVGCFALGLYGIIYSSIAISKTNLN